MKKIMELIRFLGMVVCVYTSPLVIQEAERVYFQQIVPSHVEALTRGAGRYCSGSTIQHEGKSYFVTNRHCCARGQGKFATFLETNFETKRRVLHVSNSHDVCLAESTTSSGLHISTDYSVGDVIRIIGYPRGLPLTVRKGHIFDIDSTFFGWLPGNLLHKYIHVSATAYPGNSGSPVVDRMGRVVGLLFAGDRRYVTEGIVVPSEYIIKAIEELQSK